MSRLVLTLAGVFLTLALAAPLHATLNACAAAKKLCVSKKAAALLKCHSKNEKPPGIDPTKFAACVQKAKDKFDGGPTPAKGCFAKLEAKLGAGCVTQSDTVPLEATVDAFVDDVVCQLDPAGGTCPVPTATPTPAPTSTPTPTETSTPVPTVTSTPAPPTCTDTVKNGSETDVDCGGGTCPTCVLGKLCASGSDCNTSTCAGGVCVCGSGAANCDGLLGNGCETNTAGDTNNCGNCGHVCSPNHGVPSCSIGTCQIACNSGFANCDNNAGINGCEVNTANDSNNCGACGNVCSGGQTCIASVCS